MRRDGFSEVRSQLMCRKIPVWKYCCVSTCMEFVRGPTPYLTGLCVCYKCQSLYHIVEYFWTLIEYGRGRRHFFSHLVLTSC